MDPNPFSSPPVGYILFGLVMVALLAAAIYALGAWGAARLRQGRIEDSSAIPYPEQPQSADDRETVRRVHSEGDSPDRVVSQAQLEELALGADRKIVQQTPTRGERPVDAAERNKDQHQLGPRAGGATSPAREQERGSEQDPL